MEKRQLLIAVLQMARTQLGETLTQLNHLAIDGKPVDDQICADIDQMILKLETMGDEQFAALAHHLWPDSSLTVHLN